MSGKKRLISIINPAVNVIHNVPITGAVDRYFNKSSFIFIFSFVISYLINEEKW